MSARVSGGAPYDFVVIGGGQAGVPLAHALHAAGRRVALVERKHLGGSCVNFGCTPTKAAIASARVAHLARRAGEFGVGVGPVEVDFPAVLRRARSIAAESREGLEGGFGGDGPELVRGQARLAGREAGCYRVAVGERGLLAREVVINTGTRSLVPTIEGLASVGFLHAGNWLDHEELPRDLLMVGGGYVGLEMAQFYRRMGSRVTLVEGGEHVAAHEDPEVSGALQAVLEGEGVEVLIGSRVKRLVPRDGGLTAFIEGERGDERTFSHVFVATGRQPNADDLGLETVGVRVSDGGTIEHDERLATSAPGVWVAGDVRGGPMFTHTSWDDYRILQSQLLGDGSRTTERVVPYGVFTDPELGRVGMTEAEAREAGLPVRVARFDMAGNGRAREESEVGGFVKLVLHAETGRLLGAAVLASGGAELVHPYIVLMNAGRPLSIIAGAVHVHPTRMEAVQSAALEA
ncbi:MAG TPA: FAD-dependent oxidoreductase [Deinococcales bacterium]|nr:FAD-dependent oxidoreductase [Deinococcales bacterium]